MRRHIQKSRQRQLRGRRRLATKSFTDSCAQSVRKLLDLADLWQPIRKYYERVPEPDWSPPKVLSAEEEERFFHFASRKPEWKTAYHSAVITSNTTIAGCELRVLRLEHLHLERAPPIVDVPRAVKNKNRVRAVPLNAVALASFRELAGLAKERGSHEPGHYLISYRVKRGTYDPRRGASSGFRPGERTALYCARQAACIGCTADRSKRRSPASRSGGCSRRSRGSRPGRCAADPPRRPGACARA